jgi:ankyrin repeat protein
MRRTFGLVLLSIAAVIVGVRAAEPDGTTPLMQAVLAADAPEAQRLIRAGANVTTANRYGVTALSLAALNGNAPIVSALLEAGADPNSTSAEGEPVLLTAARTGHIATVALLLARGADPNAREPWQSQTALMWAAAENHAAVVAALVARGADPNVTSAYFHDWALAPSEPATPKVTTPKGAMTALQFAARQGALDSVRALVASPTLYVDQADPDGVTALTYAAVNGHYDVAMHLLEHGADPAIVDNYGRGVLYAVVDMNRPELEPRPPVIGDDRAMALDVAELALAKGADPDAQLYGRIPSRCTNGCNSLGIEGATALWRAARSNDVAAVRLLLRRGANINLAARDGSTPFMIAAGQSWRDEHSLGSERESIEILTELLDAGAPIGAANTAGETALHGAAMRGADAVVRFLVGRGAGLDVKDKAGRTPLHTAMGIGLIVRNGGGAPVDAPPRTSTVALLRELMTARGVAIEDYIRK